MSEVITLPDGTLKALVHGTKRVKAQKIQEKNNFFEAEVDKYDSNMQLTTHEPDIKYVATWGEGSARARNLDRYGHVARKTFFAEGEEGTVENWGRLKPKLKQDIRKIKAALSNTGCMNLNLSLIHI